MDIDLLQLAKKLGDLLKLRSYKIATAESCTGGWLAQCITEAPGSSAWFDRGFVTYSNNAKIEMLGVSQHTLEKHGAVSIECAKEMVQGALANSNADWAIAITGIAGPEGGSAEKPVGTVFVAWQNRLGDVKIKKLQLSGDRHQIRKQTVSLAITGLLELIQ